MPTEMPAGEPYEAIFASNPQANAGQYEGLFASGPQTNTGQYEGLLVSHPESTVEPLPPIDGSDAPEVELPPGARDGVFQNVSFQAAWLSKGGGPEALGASTLETTTLLGFPFPRRETPLLIKPGFAVSYLDGPEMPDLPARVYDTYVQFRHMRKLSELWGIDMAVTPGVYSDFKQGSDEAFRMSGHFGGMRKCTERFDLIVGVAYLPYQDLRILPFAGFIWTPTDDWKIEITVPRPMIARRIGQLYPWPAGGWLDGGDLACNAPTTTDWVYIAGELGGGSWAIRRANGDNDVVTYRDLRLILGYERENIGGLDYHAEIAYVFCRKYDYDSTTPNIHPGDSLMLRLGATY